VFTTGKNRRYRSYRDGCPEEILENIKKKKELEMEL
jgi:hypothetical protein